MILKEQELVGELLKDIESKVLDRLIHLDRELLFYSWSNDAWYDSFTRKHHMVIVLKVKEFVVGALVGRFNKVDGVFDIDKIFVDRDYQGLGFGSCLVSSLPSFISKIYGTDFKNLDVFLEVASNNEVALNFYKKIGFLVVREVKKFYSNGSGAIILKKIMNFS